MRLATALMRGAHLAELVVSDAGVVLDVEDGRDGVLVELVQVAGPGPPQDEHRLEVDLQLVPRLVAAPLLVWVLVDGRGGVCEGAFSPTTKRALL
jgi:hypothetical protein